MVAGLRPFLTAFERAPPRPHTRTGMTGTPIRDARPDDLDALRRIYETCFPADEQTPWNEQAERIATDADAALVAHDQHGDVAGFALTTDLTADLTLLAYLAVDPSLRSTGTGAALLAEVAERARQAGRTHVLIEVEPADGPTHEMFGDPARRVRFYTRHGAALAATGYAMPNPTDDGPPLVDLDLYVLATDGHPSDRADLVTVRGWVDHLWGPACYDEDLDGPLARAVRERLSVPTRSRTPQTA